MTRKKTKNKVLRGVSNSLGRLKIKGKKDRKTQKTVRKQKQSKHKREDKEAQV